MCINWPVHFKSHVVKGSTAHWAPTVTESMGSPGDKGRYGVWTSEAYILEKTTEI